MKIGILSDTHLGYERFYEDSFAQMEDALRKLEAADVDVIVHAGDMFDKPFPSLDSLSRAYELFKSVSVPLLAIAGNHERTSSDMVNPVRFLSKTGCFTHIHRKGVVLKDVAFIGFDYVHDDKAGQALELVMEENSSVLNSARKRVLIIHQNIKDYSPGNGFEKSFLVSKGFDLIVDGHIHKRIEELPLLLPGSTLTTKINKDEIEPRSVSVVDLEKMEVEKVLLNQRKFFYDTLNFDNATAEEVREKVLSLYAERKAENPEAIVKIRLEGTLSDATKGVFLPSKKGFFLENNLKQASLEETMEELKRSFEEKKSVAAVSEQQLIKELSDKIPDAEELLLMLRDMEADEIVERLLG